MRLTINGGVSVQLILYTLYGNSNSYKLFVEEQKAGTGFIEAYSEGLCEAARNWLADNNVITLTFSSISDSSGRPEACYTDGSTEIIWNTATGTDADPTDTRDKFCIDRK
jgi:hypothetical protein